MRTRTVLHILIPWTLLASASCRSNHLVLTTSTKLGLDVSASNGQPVGAVLGYRRFEGAIVPVDPSKAAAGDPTCMSVYAAIDLENGWFSGVKLFEGFATGAAAVKLAQDPNSTFSAVHAARGAKATAGGASNPKPAPAPTPSTGNGGGQ